MKEAELIEYIKSNFRYHPDGTFERLDRRNSTGSYDKDGYLIIKIKGKQYKAHRLVFAYFNGRFPDGEIDHINRNRKDNRIENLREADRLLNIKNTTRKVNKDTGVIGVHIDKTRGLKNIYAFKFKGKTFRFRTLETAKIQHEKMYGAKYGNL